MGKTHLKVTAKPLYISAISEELPASTLHSNKSAEDPFSPFPLLQGLTSVGLCHGLISGGFLAQRDGSNAGF